MNFVCPIKFVKKDQYSNMQFHTTDTNMSVIPRICDTIKHYGLTYTVISVEYDISNFQQQITVTCVQNP